MSVLEFSRCQRAQSTSMICGIPLKVYVPGCVSVARLIAAGEAAAHGALEHPSCWTWRQSPSFAPAIAAVHGHAV